MKYAFFDLDHTLIPVDSSILWATRLLEKTGADKEELLIQRKKFDDDYRVGKLDIDAFEDFEMKLLARFKRRQLDTILEEFLKQDIEPYVLPQALELVQKAKDEGASVVLVTASYRYPVEPIAHLFGITDVICAEPEENAEGEFTGRCLLDNFKEHKIRGVKNYLSKRGENESVLKDSVFYSDSLNDLPLLDYISEQGGQAVATNPDDKLRSVAQAKGWQILDLFKKLK